MLTRRKFIYGALGLLGLGAAVLAEARFWEPFWLEFVELPMPIRGLPQELKGKLLVQISDIHVCSRIPEEYLRESFAKVAGLKPDIIAYTGDYVTHEPRIFDKLSAVVGSFPKGSLGTVAILGNHDSGGSWKEHAYANRIVRMLEAQGINVLRNEVTQIAGLQIAGLEDYWSGRIDVPTTMSKLSVASASLVLAHNPDSVDLPGWGDYAGWILSGHTHGGQCKPPFLPPPLLPVKNKRYSAGLFELGRGRRLYINRGLGYLHQVRFNCRPEITVFRLC